MSLYVLLGERCYSYRDMLSRVIFSHTVYAWGLLVALYRAYNGHSFDAAQALAALARYTGCLLAVGGAKRYVSRTRYDRRLQGQLLLS